MIDLADVFVFLGLAMLFAGIWYVYWPAALIVVGLALFGLGLLGVWRRNRT